jgi:hypothetical protein
VTTEPATTAPTARLRFSLRTFFLVAMLLTLLVSHFFTSLRLRWADQEIEHLRNAAGYLTITNPQQVHAIEIPQLDDLTYRWRVHLPAGRKFRIAATISDKIPSEEFPDKETASIALNNPQRTETEFFVTAAVRKNIAGKWELAWSVETSEPNWKQPRSVEIPNVHASWLSGTARNTWETGEGMTQSVARGEPMTLFRLRKPKQESFGLGSDSKPADGIMVWIDEEK